MMVKSYKYEPDIRISCFGRGACGRHGWSSDIIILLIGPSSPQMVELKYNKANFSIFTLKN